jgi:hypothetical protein
VVPTTERAVHCKELLSAIEPGGARGERGDMRDERERKCRVRRDERERECRVRRDEREKVQSEER